MNEVIALHAAWCNASGQELSYRASERIFFELHKLDFTADDITLAVKHLVRFNNRSSDGKKFRINAFKVCADVEYFASLVAEAKATFRNVRKAKTESEKIIAQYEQAVAPEENDPRIKGTGRHISDVFKNLAP